MVKIIQGCDVLESYNGLYHRGVQADRDHFSRQFDTWLDKICTHLQSGESLRGLVSLSTKNYVGKKTKALLELMDIKGVRTIGALAVRLLEKFDMLRVRVSMDESGTCPYCEKVMGVTEGVSGMYPNGVCTIWCVNCGGAYYYVDEAIKDNYIKSQKSVEVNMSKINTKVSVDIQINRVRDAYNKQMAVIDGYLSDLTKSVARLKEFYEKKLESQPDSWAGIGGGTELGKLEYDLRACLDFVSGLKF